MYFKPQVEFPNDLTKKQKENIVYPIMKTNSQPSTIGDTKERNFAGKKI